jgi:nucleotide-binding universal stress UspA family protein
MYSLQFTQTGRTGHSSGFDSRVSTDVRRPRSAAATRPRSAYADDAGVDLVVMGTRGEEFTENMLSSTAQTVVVRCPC